MFQTLSASRINFVLRLVLALTLCATAVPAQRPQPSPTPAPKENDPLKPLQYRSIGPYRGGRSTAVTGVASQPFVFFYGATGGGVWKSTDGGINWESVSDNSVFGTGSVGAVAVSDSDPKVVNDGRGESTIRGNVSLGDGGYKSTDGG
jgi:hypothetical protein